MVFDWKTLSIKDINLLQSSLKTKSLLGSDSTLANIFLLQKKYNIQCCIKNDIFFRFYNGQDSRYGFAFPIPLKTANTDYLKTSIQLLLEFLKESKQPIPLCLFTQEQKNQFDKCLRENFSSAQIKWDSNRNDSDYIYLFEKLSSLSGKSLQKKKNHVSRFCRTYENQWNFKTFPENNISKDILYVAEQWFKDRFSVKDEENSFSETALRFEQECIKNALLYHDILKFKGGVLYINDEPVGMTMAAQTSQDCIDIIFEKVLPSYALNGGYSAINNFFSKHCSQFMYINREEDMGVEGLRKAKLSYKPEILLDKFYGLLYI